jgi:hypothetical protein
MMKRDIRAKVAASVASDSQLKVLYSTRPAVGEEACAQSRDARKTLGLSPGDAAHG